MTVIVDDSYREEQETLKNDPVVQAMAKELEGHWKKGGLLYFSHASGTPRHEFMGVANTEYHKRGGKNSRSLGGVAKAIIDILQSQPQPTPPRRRPYPTATASGRKEQS